jgi:protein-S-isoprenylcysteine O-methyltransferase
MTQLFANVLGIVSTIWVASEMALAILRRAAATSDRRDAGSLTVLNITIYASVAVAVPLGLRGYGALGLPAGVKWAGLVVILLGLALRWWAILTLRRFFTVDVAIRDDHEIVAKGPYRWVRHPAYSGSLLSFAGLGVCLGSWVSLAVIMVPTIAAFLHRIGIEERALAQALPAQYAAHASRTWRLVPWLY